jgi:hypothetical protein
MARLPRKAGRPLLAALLVLSGQAGRSPSRLVLPWFARPFRHANKDKGKRGFL